MLGLKTFTLVSLLACASGTLAHAQSSTTTLPASSLEPTPKRPLTGEWKFGIGGTTYAEDRDEGAAAELVFGAKFDYHFNKILYAHVEPEAVLYSGRLQERYDNDAYSSRIGLVDGFVGLKPIPFVEGRAGAINQGFLRNPLLISKHRAFPGAQEIVMSDTKPVNVKLVAQQLIPTSYSLNFERSEKEPLPSFQTQSLHLHGEHDEVDWEVSTGHYSWARLPDKIAFESARAGNSVEGGEAAPGARFKYAFDGVFAHAWTRIGKRQPVSLNLEYTRNRNLRAPGEAADAQMFAIGPIVRLGDTELSLQYGRYFIESDSTVARYLPGSLGYANRMGDRVEAELHFKNEKFRIKGHWTNALTVANRPEQQTMTEVYLGVETDYAPF